MNRSQRRSLIYLVIAISAISIITWYSYTNSRHIREESAVYLGVFNPKPNIIDFKDFVVMSSPGTCQANKANLKDFPADIVKRFLSANNNAKPIRLSGLEGKVPIVSWEYTQKLYSNGLLKTFTLKSRKLFHLSRVGFDKTMTRALLCIKTRTINQGQANLIYLNKISNKWKIYKIVNIWRS